MKRKIVLLISLAAGLIAAVLTRLYIASKESEVQRQKNALEIKYGKMNVLCVGRDVPAGTVLTEADLAQKIVPALGMRGQALQKEDLSEVLGRKTVISHKKGDVLFWADIEGGNSSNRGLSSDIKRQMRAISINVNGSSSVSGMVRPNDHVDVIGTFDFPDESGKMQRNALVTCTILQNVLVLATGNDTAKTRARDKSLGVSGNSYSTVTLEVTPREAEMLAFTEQIKGRLILTLRNRNDTSYERELPKVDFKKIQGEIEKLNLKRQTEKLGGR